MTRRVPALSALRLAAALAGMLNAGMAMAASLVVLQKGDGQDQILTVTGDDGTTETSITFICEYPKREYGIVVQAPAGATQGSGLRLTADGRAVAARSSARGAGATMFMLKGRAGQHIITRLTAARVVEAESGTRRMRFAISDGASEVARFRQLCGL